MGRLGYVIVYSKEGAVQVDDDIVYWGDHRKATAGTVISVNKLHGLPILSIGRTM